MYSSINKDTVGRIAERITAIELESRGFHVTDLNKDGIKANADLLAAKGGRTVQLQVKGSTWDESDPGWWFNYGFATIIKSETEVCQSLIVLIASTRLSSLF